MSEDKMSGWNRRVMKRTFYPWDPELKEVIFAVYEVYYNEDGEVVGWTEDPVAPVGESLQGLLDELARFHQASKQTILDYNELEAKFEDSAF